MSSSVSSISADNWDSVDFHGREFVQFQLPIRDDQTVWFMSSRRIGERYDVNSVLARGGGGVILRATDLRTKNAVLIKALTGYNIGRNNIDQPLDSIVEGIRRKRHHLQTERRILVQLCNSGCNAVPHPIDYVYDALPMLYGPHTMVDGETWTLDDEALLTSEPYLAMHHVPGVGLEDILKTHYRNGLPAATATQIIDQVADVIHRLQQPWSMPNDQTWNLIYQDLKPDNIIVDQYGQATVLDFGGCQIVVDGTLVLHGSHSPGYSAPECGKNETQLTPSADCYGMATTLFHMLTGINPRNPSTRLKQSSDDTFANRLDLTPVAKRYSPAMVKFLGDCLAIEPGERLETPMEFRRRLHECPEFEPILPSSGQ